MIYCTAAPTRSQPGSRGGAQFSAFYRGAVSGITAELIRDFGATLKRLRPASRARKQAALASFLGWAHHQARSSH